jgi:hypothetical protein
MSNADDAGRKRLCASRAALGAGYLTWSAWAAGQRRGAPPVRAVAAVLGARHLAQALLTADRAPRAALALGAEADAAHCASMLALALASRRWRAAALADALLAGALAATGATCARNLAGGRQAADGHAGPLSSRRDRYARSLARYLAPSWLSGGTPPDSRGGR